MTKSEIIKRFQEEFKTRTKDLNYATKENIYNYIQTKRIPKLKDNIDYNNHNEIIKLVTDYIEEKRSHKENFGSSAIPQTSKQPIQQKPNPNVQPKSPSSVQQPNQQISKQPEQQTQQPNQQINNFNISPDRIKNNSTKYLPGLQKFYTALTNYKKMLDSQDFKFFDTPINGYTYAQILQGSQYISNPQLKQFGRIYDRIKNYLSTFKDFQQTLILSGQSIELLKKAQTGDVNSYMQFLKISQPLFKEINRFETLFEQQLGSGILGTTASDKTKFKFITHIALTGFSISDAQMKDINEKIPYDKIKEILADNPMDKIKNIYNMLNIVTQEVKEVKDANVMQNTIQPQNVKSVIPEK